MSMMPVCPDCRVHYGIHRTGVWVVEMFLDPPQPYCIWSADSLICPGCENVIIDRSGETPVAYHHHEGFGELLDAVCVKDPDGVYYCFERANDPLPR